VLVRAARREPRTRLARARVALIVLAAALTTGSCSGRATTATNLSWTLTPSPPTVGPASFTVTLRDPAGGAVTGAKMRLEGHMSHPGMTPVVAEAAERTPGVYAVPFTLTMPGDWVLLVSAALPNGERLEHRVEVPGVRP
jgi:hypothetical protein